LKTRNHKLTFFFILPIVVTILFLADISYGAVRIPIIEVFQILLQKLVGIKNESAAYQSHPSWEIIIWQFRLPKAMTAILVGAGLSTSGLQMQTLFRNPLADAYTLGISSGASLGVALLILVGVSVGNLVGQWAIVFAAIMGALAVMLLILFVAVQVRNMVSLLIIGMMLGNGIGAIIIILQSFSGKDELQRYVNWSYGTLGAVDWTKMQIFLPISLLGILVTLFLHKPLNISLLGENYAQSMGLNLRKVRAYIILVNSIITGVITAFCGIIGFVGIAVPHICRQIFDTSDHKILLPACILIGASLMLVCDMLCQLPHSPQILPINAITALVGVPVVVWVILKARNW
jgi:iron complex transport system permease protein